MYNRNYNYIKPEDYWVSINQVHLLQDMNVAWLEHIFWTRLILISIAENLRDLNATRTRLLQNPKTISNIFRRYYGVNIANSIEKLLTEHLVIGEKLIVALKNNNQPLAKQLNDEWYMNADEMAEAFSNINPFYVKDEVRNMLYEHLNLTSNEVAARLRKDYNADIQAFDKVQLEILKMSKYFVDGIIKQFPDIF